MKHIMSEEEVEQAALEMLRDELGYDVINGLDLAPDGAHPERATYQDVVLVDRLRRALERIPANKHLPEEAIEQAVKQVLRSSSHIVAMNNHDFHAKLVNGVPVEYRHQGRIKHENVWLVDKTGKHNEFLAVNQFTIIENNQNRRPDIILFLNGLPVVIIELKNPASEQATLESARQQLMNYIDMIPTIFNYNEFLIVSDGTTAITGTITAPKERFVAWKTINGKRVTGMSELECIIKGMLNKETLLDLLLHFIFFEKNKEKIFKIIASYHQYDATNNAVASTIRATKGDKKAGVVWHSTGAGKSFTMLFYAGKIVDTLDNPTIIILTDRNDLDDQLHDTFAKGHELLRQKPTHAENREQLKEVLSVASGGVVFTTIQKFSPEGKEEKFPLLSERKNIIVIADEAHRTQYGFKAKVTIKDDKALIKYGFAKYVRDAIPNASFIAFTGTPVETKDHSTPAVFGKCIDIYDMQRAVEDNVTVTIYYESRLAKLELKPEERPHIDENFEEVTEREEMTEKERLKSKWAQLEKVVGSPNRLKKIAADIVEHYEARQEIMDGKAMIVCMSRRICVELHNELVKLRPDWYDKDDEKGAVKVIMTGSASDPKGWQEHIRNKPRRRSIGDRFKEPKDPLKIVIVRDMWLTGFDVPCMHTMYLDKPTRDQGLIQAISRVNRVFRDKKGGLIVDYIGIAQDLKKALTTYTESGGKGKPTVDQELAVKTMMEKYEVVTAMYHGFKYKQFFTIPAKQKMALIPDAMEHILKQEKGKERYLRETSALITAFSLSVPHEKAMAIKDEVGFFQAIRSAIAKTTGASDAQSENLESAIRQIISKSVISDRVIDIFAAAGLNKPNLAVLSDQFLAEVKEMPQKNLAFESLRRILNDEIRIMMKKNKVQGRSFLEMLEKTIRAYTNKSIDAAEALAMIVENAKAIRESAKRGEILDLSDEEVAFYDALEANDSAVKILGNDTLKDIARELVKTIRNNVTIDWTLRDNVRAELRVAVKRVLKKYGYPPDMREKATATVLEQAETLAKDWAEVAD